VGAWPPGREPSTSAKGGSERASAGDDDRTLPQRFEASDGRLDPVKWAHSDTVGGHPRRGLFGAVVMAAFSGRQRRAVVLVKSSTNSLPAGNRLSQDPVVETGTETAPGRRNRGSAKVITTVSTPHTTVTTTLGTLA
jgi:hypothetical protein